MATKKKAQPKKAAKKKNETEINHWDKSLLSSAKLLRVTGQSPHEIADYMVDVEGTKQRRMDLISKMPQEWLDQLGIEMGVSN